MASLEHTVVVVIGGSSGIGLAAAKLAVEAGAAVTICGRDQERLASALDELGGNVKTACVDVADEAAVRDLFSGFDHVDHVVNLAGSHVNGNIVDLDVDAMRVPMENRFWGPVNVFKYAAPKMTTGSITLTTGAGVVKPRPGGSIVSASAGASEFLAFGMAAELAPIRVNVIRPGLVDTPLLDRLVAGAKREDVIGALSKRIPLRRVATPEDIADGIRFLMMNDYVTGTTLTIDGGFGLS